MCSHFNIYVYNFSLTTKSPKIETLEIPNFMRAVEATARNVRGAGGTRLPKAGAITVAAHCCQSSFTISSSNYEIWFPNLLPPRILLLKGSESFYNTWSLFLLN